MGKGMGGIISGVAAGALFLFFFIFLDLGPLVSAIAGVAGFAALMLVFAGTRKALPVTGDSNAAMVQEVAANCEARAREIESLRKDLAKGPIKDKLGHLAELCIRIAKDVRQDPKDARDAGRFINYYGETACKIARIYRDLDRQGIESSSIIETRQKVAGHLDTLVKAFEVHLAQLQEDNLMDLDTELKVLEKTIEMEGLGDMIRQEETKTAARKTAEKNKVDRPWDA